MVFFGGRERYERLAKGYARFEQVCPAATRTSTAMAVRRRYERLDEGMRDEGSGGQENIHER